MSREANLKLVQDTMAAFLAGDPGPLLAALTEDAIIKAVIRDPRGRRGLTRFSPARHDRAQRFEGSLLANALALATCGSRLPADRIKGRPSGEHERTPQRFAAMLAGPAMSLAA